MKARIVLSKRPGTLPLLLCITLLLLLSLLLHGCKRARESYGAHRAGQFDHYILALNWQPAFCETHEEKPECRTQSKGRFDARHFSLHGLWPSKQDDKGREFSYCGVSDALRRQDRIGAWCALPVLPLSEEMRSALTTVMPGIQSCLQRHEWLKHGTYSGLAPEEYYRLSLQLVEFFADTQFSRYVAVNVGHEVKRAEMLSAFEQDFGPGSRRQLQLWCNRINEVQTLTEVYLYLRKDLPDPLSPAALWAKGAPRIRPDCPRTFHIHAVGVDNS